MTVQMCLVIWTCQFKIHAYENSLVVQLSGLGTFTSESAGSILSWETKVLQATQCGLQKKIKKAIKKINKICAHISPPVPGPML